MKTSSQIDKGRRRTIQHLAWLGAGTLLLSPNKLMAALRATNESIALTKPYLQNPSEDAITIAWTTRYRCYSWVEYGLTESLGQKAVAEQYGATLYWNTNNKIRLKGLTPGKIYFYKVYSHQMTKNEAYNKTFALLYTSDIFRFAMPDLKQDTLEALFLNDVHNTPASIRTLIDKSGSQNYNFVFFNGDMLSTVENETAIVNNLISPACTKFATTIPFFYSRGNHEARGAYASNLINYIDNPGGKYYFSFQWGPVLFVAIDTGEDKEDSDNAAYGGAAFFDDYRLAQASWVDSLLSASTALYKVIVMHIPPFHSGSWHGTMHCRTIFNSLFTKHKITLLIAGHTHSAQFCPIETFIHNYPILIGGGPEEGKRFIIRVEANSTRLNAELINDSGIIIQRFEKKA